MASPCATRAHWPTLATSLQTFTDDAATPGKVLVILSGLELVVDVRKARKPARAQTQAHPTLGTVHTLAQVAYDTVKGPETLQLEGLVGPLQPKVVFTRRVRSTHRVR